MRTKPSNFLENISDTVSNDEYDLYEFLLIENVLVVSCSKQGYREALTLGSVAVYGVTTAPHNVSTGGRAVEFRYSPNEKSLANLSLLQVAAPLRHGEGFSVGCRSLKL
ncbi:hypothetical protein HPB47_018407 [Ixodes persulcatus]|uniref:Uncharacterized protein n=1 Tax=Ixodes persulcatus TaxID=34615 RepID=A0AC60R2Y1_IXOPE|nr:hypothetical protein HPB47_018407 [Ixodes persulcatus]